MQDSIMIGEKTSKPKSRLYFIVICVVIVAVVIGSKVFGTVFNTLEVFWAQYQSPYNLHNEFILNKLLAAHRPDIHFLTFGLLDDWAKQKHQNIMYRVKNKIPTSDDAWLEYWYDSEAKFWPYDDKDHSAERIPVALQYMDMLMAGDSKVVQFNKAWRYNIWVDLAYYVVNNVYQSIEEDSEKYDLTNKLIKDSNIIYKKLDLEYLMNRKGIEIFLPFRILSNRNYLYVHLIKMQNAYHMFECTSDLAINFKANMSEILNMKEQYVKVFPYISQNLKVQISNLINIGVNDIKNSTKLINSYCNL